MNLEKQIGKSIESSRKGDGRIDGEKLGELIARLFEDGAYSSAGVVSALIFRQERLIEEDRLLRGALEREGRLREQALAAIQSQVCKFNGCIEDLDALAARLVKASRSHVAEVEIAAKSLDYQKLGRELYDQLYKVSLQKLEEAPRGVEIATNRLVKEFDIANSRLSQRMDRRWPIGRSFLWLLLVAVLAYFFGAISFQKGSSQNQQLATDLVEELSKRNARLVEMGGKNILVVDDAVEAVINEKGRGILVLSREFDDG